MDYNHKDIIIFISTCVSKVINWAIMLVFIIAMCLMLYYFWIFIVHPYKDGEDPVQKWWKDRKEKDQIRQERSGHSYLLPVEKLNKLLSYHNIQIKLV
ncbi:MAG: hypothetical protein AB1782_05010 [Cyanobacteriota bacterium]